MPELPDVTEWLLENGATPIVVGSLIVLVGLALVAADLYARRHAS